MTIRTRQPNIATINHVLDRLMTDPELLRQFELDRKAALQTLALNVEDYEALLALDYKEFLAAANTILNIRARCI